MAQYQSVSVASITSAIAAVCAWGLAALSAWGNQDPRGLAIEVGIGTTATLVSVMWQLTGRRERLDRERLDMLAAEYRRREAVLIKAAARLADAPETGPLPRLYPVS